MRDNPKNMSVPKYVLIVDDDPDDRSLLDEALRRYDSTVLLKFAKSGNDAILIVVDAIKNNKLPALITLDINMPGMNGWATLKELQLLLEDIYIPILFLTTSPQDNDILLAQRQRITVYRKPRSVAEYGELAKTIFMSVIKA